MSATLPIRARLAILVGAAALPFIALIAYNVYTQALLEMERAGAESMRSARLVAAEAQRTLQRAGELLVYLSQQPSVRALDAARCESLFDAYGGLVPQGSSLLTVRRDGERVCSASKAPATASTRVDPQLYLEQTLRAGEFSVGRVARGEFNGRWIVHVAQPIATDAAADAPASSRSRSTSPRCS